MSQSTLIFAEPRIADNPSTGESAVGQLLEKLVDFEPTTFPVLSVYLNMQPDQHGRTPDLRPYLEREFKSLAHTWLAGTPERESFDRDAERILTLVDDGLDRSSNGLALFACSAREFFESIQLEASIHEHRIYVYHQPHLYQLALIDDENPRYAAVLTDASRARIFVFGLGTKEDESRITGKKMHRVKVGGWSQARYQRRVENAQQHHLKEVAEHLAKIVREDRVTQIVIAGDSEMVPRLMGELPQELRGMVVEGPTLARDASEQEIFSSTLDKIKEESVKSDAEKVDRLLEAYRSRGLGVVGPEATLEALTNGQVDELLLSKLLERTNEEPVQVDAIVAPEIPDSGGGTESDGPREASLPDLLVTKGRQTGAGITFIEDSTMLESVGGVGAFLRWRNS
jgi:peptide subunit release factor 1 (eRF1)